MSDPDAPPAPRLTVHQRQAVVVWLYRYDWPIRSIADAAEINPATVVRILRLFGVDRSAAGRHPIGPRAQAIIADWQNGERSQRGLARKHGCSPARARQILLRAGAIR